MELDKMRLRCFACCMCNVIISLLSVSGNTRDNLCADQIQGFV